MLEKLIIENYKSIDKLELNLGRVNVFIGENGSGKSNILEAISASIPARNGWGHRLNSEQEDRLLHCSAS